MFLGDTDENGNEYPIPEEWLVRGAEGIKAPKVSVPWVCYKRRHEFKKCATDPIYFIKNYVSIMGPKGRQVFELYDYQKKMVTAYREHKNNILNLPRQVGKTSTTSAFALWYSVFHKDKKILILANKDDLAKETLSTIMDMYSRLPFWMKPGVEEKNKGSLVFENNSSIKAKPTSVDSARGFSIDLLILDEFAFLKPEMEEDFYTAVMPTLATKEDGRCIILSTPKGMNLFYKLWTDAEAGVNDFNPVRIHWNQPPKRDLAWKKAKIAEIGEDKWYQEYEAQFIGSSNTLISPTVLKEMEILQPMHPLEVPHCESNKRALSVYEAPDPEKTYVITVDSGHGKGMDFSAFSVFDVTTMPYKQVAVFRDNNIPFTLYPIVIKKIAMMYNDAWCLIEINDVGSSVAKSLTLEHEYNNVFTVGSLNGNPQELGMYGVMGLRTTQASKHIGCLSFKELIDGKNLIIHDKQTQYELSRFVLSKSGLNWEADAGSTDDIVATLFLFGWMVKQDYFKNTYQLNNFKQFEDDASAFNEALPTYSSHSFGNNTDADTLKELMG